MCQPGMGSSPSLSLSELVRETDVHGVADAQDSGNVVDFCSSSDLATGSMQGWASNGWAEEVDLKCGYCVEPGQHEAEGGRLDLVSVPGRGSCLVLPRPSGKGSRGEGNTAPFPGLSAVGMGQAHIFLFCCKHPVESERLSSFL